MRCRFTLSTAKRDTPRANCGAAGECGAVPGDFGLRCELPVLRRGIDKARRNPVASNQRSGCRGRIPQLTHHPWQRPCPWLRLGTASRRQGLVWKEEVMGSDTPHRSEGRDVSPRSELGRRIDTAAWAAFLIWFGASILANVGWGWFLAGLGIIVLVAQAALRIASEKNDGLWLIGGAVFLVAGICEIFNLQWPLAPLLVILLGVGLLWRAFFSRPK